MLIVFTHAKWHVSLYEITGNECFQHLARCSVIIKPDLGKYLLTGVT